MFSSFIKIAYRNFARNKVFSFINIAGLAAGLATCLLIILYISDELNYDKHHKDADRIYRLVYSTPKEDWSAQPAPVAAALKNDISDIEEVTRLVKFPNMDKVLMRYEHSGQAKQFFEINGYYVDSTFFRIFNYDFQSGNPQTALNEPNTLVISQAIAQKLFGNEDPIGRPIKVALPFGEFSYTVKGVFKNTGDKTHIPSNFFLSMRNSDVGSWVEAQTSWATNNIFHTYFKVKPGTDINAFTKKLQPFFDRHAGEELKKAGYTKTLYIQPVKDIYLHSAIGNEIAANGNIKYIYILASIGVFILLIACINFMNLSTARSEKRAREVGVRKVMGAGKGSLIRQFLFESLIMSFASLIMALTLAWLFLPLFNSITNKDMHFFNHPGFLYLVGTLTVLTGVLSGLYPAFYLSAFKPVLVLKGKLANDLSATFIRKGLVVFQFAVSACLMLGAIVMWKQLDFVQSRQLGFNKDQQLVLPLQDKQAAMNYYSLKTELLRHPGVKSVTSGSTYPGIPNINSMLFYAEGKTSHDFVDVHTATVENDYFSTLGLNFIKGRPFFDKFTADTGSIIFNESAIKQLGYTVENAIGRKVNWEYENVHHSMNIVGIVSDFNFESLHNPIKPFAFTTINFFGNKYAYAIAKLNTTDYSETMSHVKRTWTNINPAMPFAYSFIDQDFENNYEKEKRASKIVVSFTCIAILIACLGLFGLATFSAETRTKEIGIRKVLGATETAIFGLLSKGFLKLVVIALVIALPLSAWLMNTWLNNFAYRISISWWMFVIAGGIALLIAFATISYQSIKSAFANPIKNMRTE